VIRFIITGWPHKEKAKILNVHFENCKKMDHETALQIAWKLKAEAVGSRIIIINFYNFVMP